MTLEHVMVQCSTGYCMKPDKEDQRESISEKVSSSNGGIRLFVSLLEDGTVQLAFRFMFLTWMECINEFEGYRQS